MEIDLMEPQINADECRFVNLNIQRLSEVYQGNSLIKSPHRSQSTAISASTYEPAPPSREGTRMTRIVRNLHANCMQIARKNYNLTLIVRGYRENKPQINADKRRFVNLDIQHLSEVYQRNSLIKSPQSTQSRAARIFAYFTLWYEKINNELGRTPYELTLPEFVSVRISSLFFSCSFMKQGFIADFAVKSRSYLRELFNINSAYVAAFIRIHPRLIFRRKTQEALV